MNEINTALGFSFAILIVAAAISSLMKNNQFSLERMMERFADIPSNNEDPHRLTNVRLALPDLHFRPALMVEKLSFDHDEWTEDAFIEHIAMGCQVMVYENYQCLVVGYIVYFLAPKKQLEILRFAVQPAGRRIGVGDALIRRVIQLAVECDVDKVVCDVSEEFEPAWKLLESRGFRRAKTLEPMLRESPAYDMYRYILVTDAMCPN